MAAKTIFRSTWPWAMSRGPCASPGMSGLASGLSTGSRRCAPSRPFTASASSVLAFLLPGFVGPELPGAFAAPTAYGDFATALLAMSVLLTARVRVLFLPLVWAFNLVGAADLLMATVHAVRVDLPSIAGQLGAGYAILMLYVPLLLITHGLAFSLLVRPAQAPARSAA